VWKSTGNQGGPYSADKRRNEVQKKRERGLRHPGSKNRTDRRTGSEGMSGDRQVEHLAGTASINLVDRRFRSKKRGGIHGGGGGQGKREKKKCWGTMGGIVDHVGRSKNDLEKYNGRVDWVSNILGDETERKLVGRNNEGLFGSTGGGNKKIVILYTKQKKKQNL